MKEKLGYIIQISPSVLLNSKQGTYRLDKIPSSAFLLDHSSNRQKIVQKKYVNEEKEDVYQLSLKNGNTILLGGETFVDTINGMKAVKDINDEDYLRHKIQNTIVNQERGNLDINWENEIKTNANPIIVPEKMSPELALWLGIICSKGKILKTGLVGVNSRDTKILTYFVQLTFEIFKLKPEVVIDKHTGMPIAFIISKNISRFLFDYIGNVNKLRKVPKQIMEGSSAEQMAFIRGLSLDGYVENKRLYLYGGVSKKIATFISNSMRNFGYHVTLRQKFSGSGSLCYSIKIVGKCADAFPFVPIETKKQEAEIPLYNYLAKAKDKDLEDVSIKTNHPNYSAIRNLRQRKPDTCYAFIFENSNIDFDKSSYYVEVKSCRKITSSTKMMFEIQTYKPEGLVVDGLILLGHKK